MKKSLCVFLLVMINCGFATPEILKKFPYMVNPIELRIKKDHMYISDQYSVFIINMKNFDLVKKIGNRGEGPEEFRTSPRVSFTDNKLILYDSNKIVVYSHDLKFIKEIKLTTYTDRVIPIDDNFVLSNSRIIGTKDYRVFTLYNNDLTKIKDLLVEVKTPNFQKFLINPWSRCRSRIDEIFIAQPNKGFYIEVFDKNGNKLYTIFKKMKKIKTEEKHKKFYMDEIRYFVGNKLFQKALQKGAFNKEMREFVPVINNFWVLDDFIYVKTFDITDTSEKYIIMDLKGKILKEMFLPKTYLEILTFYNNKFYFLIENEVDDAWELQSIGLGFRKNRQKMHDQKNKTIY